MVADSKPVIAITDSNCQPAIAASQVPVLLLDSKDFSQSELRGTNPDPASQGLTPDHPAYVIYTSGSTGQPKGVVCVHRGLANLAAVQSRAFPVDGSSRVIQFASTSFDSSVWELSLAFFHGGTLCLASREAMTPGDALRQCLQTFQITHVTLPPSALAVLGSPVDLPHLQVVIAAGEACPPALAERWAGHCRFFNGYGPTENTVAATLYQCDELPRSTLPIGHPIANGKIYVLDEQHQLLPIGAKGEIHVAGAGLAQGYLHRETLTFERFVNVPTVEANSTRMYKTGDLGRWLSSGAVEFCGRNDLQVKLRGYRVELGEIESALAALPEVSYCAVMVREDTPGLQRLVAYLVANGQDRSTTPALREALLRALPDYMVPSHYIWLDALPVTPNGKIDRQVLPQPDRKRPESGTPYLRAHTPMEQHVCDAFAEVLELDMVGRNDNFFELGGTSLLVMRTLDNLTHRSGQRLSAPTFFAHPTPAGLVEMLNGQQFDEPGSDTQGEAALTDPR
ncbi:MAG: amino acid adenylation domain-containing protein, partial [Rhodoferax sp.]